MGTRIKWFILNHSTSVFGKLRDGMLKNDLVPDARTGFRLEHFDEKQVLGRFIVRNEISESVEDPFGNNVTFQRVLYETTKFRIDEVSSILELQDPPRSTREFFNKLAALAEYGIGIETPAVDLLRWINRIEDRVGNVVVTKLQGTGISLSLKATAQLLVTGSEDVRSHFTALTGKRSSIFSRAKVQFFYDNCSYDLEINNQGSTNINKDSSQTALNLLLETMLESLITN